MTSGRVWTRLPYAADRRVWPPRSGRELQIRAVPACYGRRRDGGHGDSAARTRRGAFRFDDLPPGPAIVVAHADGFAPHFGTLNVDAGNGQSTRIGLLLEAVAGGLVVDSNEDPVEGARIRIGYDRLLPGAGFFASFSRGRAMTPLPSKPSSGSVGRTSSPSLSNLAWLSRGSFCACPEDAAMLFLRFLRTAPVVAALAATTGCATLETNGSTQRVEVSSTPPAAEVFLDGQAVGVTPVEVVVSRRDPIPAIRIEKDGFRPSEQKLRRSTSWWLLADVGVGVLISIFDPHFGHTAGVAAGAMPVVLDYLTGAAFRFQPAGSMPPWRRPGRGE